MPKPTLRILGILAAITLSTSLACAQTTKEITKSADGLKGSFTTVVSAAAESTVQVKCSNSTVALGTVVDAKGLIITKASELTGDITVKLRDGRILPARIVDTRNDLDLAILKVDASDLKPITWADAPKIDVGEWVAAPGMPDRPVVAVGIVSTPRRVIPPIPGVLGVSLADSDDGKGVKIAEVIPGSAAEKARLKANDVILKIDGKEANTRAELSAMIHKCEPGTLVTLTVDRDGREIEIKATLAATFGDPTGGGRVVDPEVILGGPVSKRASNFPAVIQHDTVLRITECGGPLVDLEGKVLGINIARAGRTESYAIPADLVKPFVDKISAAATQPAAKAVSAGTKAGPQ